MTSPMRKPGKTLIIEPPDGPDLDALVKDGTYSNYTLDKLLLHRKQWEAFWSAETKKIIKGSLSIIHLGYWAFGMSESLLRERVTMRALNRALLYENHFLRRWLDEHGYEIPEIDLHWEAIRHRFPEASKIIGESTLPLTTPRE